MVRIFVAPSSDTSESMGGQTEGTAPKAHLVVQSLLGDDNNTIFGHSHKTLGDLLQDALGTKPRIHTNSWDPVWSPVTGRIPYNNSSVDLDSLVFTHEDMVVLCRWE